MIIDKLDDMIIDEDDTSVKKLFIKQPTITWDNYFSGDTISNYADDCEAGQATKGSTTTISPQETN
eukprot:5824567-Ditylum_brightwellii.AAC.2